MFDKRSNLYDFLFASLYVKPLLKSCQLPQRENNSFLLEDFYLERGENNLGRAVFPLNCIHSPYVVPKEK